jgi:hypothetical protein
VDPGSWRSAPSSFDALTDSGCCAFTVPKDIALRAGARMLFQALVETGHQIRGHIHVAILAPFALENA